MSKFALIVEDNPAHAMMIEDVLAMEGFETEHAANGAEAQKQIRDRRPDLILMDIQLPDISGIDLTKAVKADDGLRDIPIVAVTAFATRKNELGMRDAGCIDILTKPFSLTDLIEIVDRYLGDSGQPRA